MPSSQPNSSAASRTLTAAARDVGCYHGVAMAHSSAPKQAPGPFPWESTRPQPAKGVPVEYCSHRGGPPPGERRADYWMRRESALFGSDSPGGVGIQDFLPEASVRAWLSPSRVSVAVWVSIP